METIKENQLFFQEEDGWKKNARKVKSQHTPNSEEMMQTYQALMVALGLSGHAFTQKWLRS